MKLSIIWFRRDLRFEDNNALQYALDSGFPVLPVFMFDNNILQELAQDDPRVTFIYDTLEKLDSRLKSIGSSFLILKGDPVELWNELISTFDIAAVYVNKDYEPYAIERDDSIKTLLNNSGTRFLPFKDQVIFEEHEITKENGKPYTVYTPYKNKWLNQFVPTKFKPAILQKLKKYHLHTATFPSLEDLGFRKSTIGVRPYDLSILESYHSLRNFPAEDCTSYLSTHLRFGTVSIRQVIAKLGLTDGVFLNELIWREFFMQILFHFPKVVNENFHSKYDAIQWRNREDEFQLWCQGKTGYPLVDAGMRQLNQTGYMHNRVRMVTASFLCKHLLIDWRWGESYFAQKLIDYELSSNNGNWQWAAGTGCDAAPYFRVFNPTTQMEKFDKELKYINTWIPEYGSQEYPLPLVDHAFARARALEVYTKGINR